MDNLSPTARILALDPGKTTGFALWQPSSVQCWQAVLTHDEFIQSLNEIWPDIIVCESFVHTHRDAVDYTPVEFISLTKWFVERKPVDLVFQTPSFGKGYFNDEKLKKLGIYKRGAGHAMDALRHLFQFRMQHKLLDLSLLK